MIKQEDVYQIGRIGKPHGVGGEVQMQFSDDIFDRSDADYLVIDCDGILVPFFIEEYRFRSDSVVLMKFLDIDTQDEARELTGCAVFFPRNLSESTEEHVSLAIIIGFTLRDAATNEEIGTVESVDDSTLNILFTVRRADGNEVLIPVSENLIEDIDTVKRQISMNLPEGILDL